MKHSRLTSPHYTIMVVFSGKTNFCPQRLFTRQKLKMSHITTSKKSVRCPTVSWAGLPDPTRRENRTNPRVGSENQLVKTGRDGSERPTGRAGRILKNIIHTSYFWSGPFYRFYGRRGKFGLTFLLRRVGGF